MSLGFWKWANQVNMYVIEAPCCWLEPLQWGFGMGMDFGPLAAETGPCPTRNLFIKAMPDKF